jgi:peptide/nickel transport system permease protein
VVAGVVVVLITLAAIAAPLVAPVDPTVQDLEDRLLPPTFLGGVPEHPLGTDSLGRDTLSRLVYGARVSLLVAGLAVVLAGGAGSLLGVTAGYVGGRTDSVIMRLADIQLSIPFLVLAIALVAVIGPNATNLVLVMAISGWVFYARVVRADVLRVREREYILAARAIGLRERKILSRHVVPNIMTTIVILVTLEAPRMILTEAALSFIGLGVQSPTPSWGNMIADGRDYLNIAWWLVAIPGIAIAVFAMSVSIIGDFLRDVLDPRSAAGSGRL